jgi:cyclophilin family peptidyl-prolyl cis-trans isomerase
MRAFLLVICITFSSIILAQESPVIEIETTMGNIKIELRPDLTPLTVENFLRYIDNNYYDGLIFHRVISGFMIQGGGFDANMVQKSTYDPIKNEADTGISNARGTISMARTNVVDSATSQFFINLVNNGNLDHRNTSASGYGYTAFGDVIEGLDVIDQIAGVPTGSERGYSDVPLEPVTIISVKRSE